MTDNEIDLVIERKHEALEQILRDNQVEGDARIPQNFLCNVF